MKSMHFCTEKNLLLIKNLINSEKGGFITTLRTGWIPDIYQSDIIKINERKDNVDTFLCYGYVMFVHPIKFCDIDSIYEEEVKKYHKNFNHEHYFFEFHILLPVKENFSLEKKKHLEYEGIDNYGKQE